MTALLQSPLDGLHRRLGARMGAFAGYDLPMRYEAGALDEHLHTRSSASLFDVTHMGILHLHGDGAAEALETLVPAALVELGVGRSRYTQLTNNTGGVIDDLIVTNAGTHLVAVVNGATKEGDVAHLQAHLPSSVELSYREDLVLLALQGPAAAEVVTAEVAEASDLTFMTSLDASFGGIDVAISRSGYTGEDGFEFTVASADASALAEQLLAHPAVEPAGLAARDSLRLEAGLCLYGNDLDPHTTPVEAGLTWSIQKRRRSEGGFLGSDVVLDQIANGPSRLRVGIAAQGRKPIRAGAELRSENGDVVGVTTSGGFGPTADRPVAMGYVTTDLSTPGTPLIADVRGSEVPCLVADLPFVAANYKR